MRFKGLPSPLAAVQRLKIAAQRNVPRVEGRLIEYPRECDARLLAAFALVKRA
jgi:hypothetical protein